MPGLALQKQKSYNYVGLQNFKLYEKVIEIHWNSPLSIPVDYRF